MGGTVIRDERDIVPFPRPIGPMIQLPHDPTGPVPHHRISKTFPCNESNATRLVASFRRLYAAYGEEPCSERLALFEKPLYILC